MRIYFEVKEGFSRFKRFTKSKEKLWKTFGLMFLMLIFCSCKLTLLLERSNYGLWIVCGVSGVLGS